MPIRVISHTGARPLQIVRAPEPGEGLVKGVAQRPVLGPPHMTLEDGVDEQLAPVWALKQRVRFLVWPVERDSSREGDEEIVEQVVDRLILLDQFLSHTRERNVIDPRWVGDLLLCGRGASKGR